MRGDMCNDPSECTERQRKRGKARVKAELNPG